MSRLVRAHQAVHLNPAVDPFPLVLWIGHIHAHPSRKRRIQVGQAPPQESLLKQTGQRKLDREHGRRHAITEWVRRLGCECRCESQLLAQTAGPQGRHPRRSPDAQLQAANAQHQPSQQEQLRLQGDESCPFTILASQGSLQPSSHCRTTLGINLLDTLNCITPTI